MTSHIQGPGVQPEGTSLPPPRPFGDANTLTLPRRRAREHGGVLALAASADQRGQVLSAGILRLDPERLTLTF